MAFRTILVGLLALVCGVSATVGVLNLVGNKKVAEANSASVAVARMDIPYGIKITSEMVEMRDWPSDLLPPNSVKDIDGVVGKFAMATMIRNEPIMSTKLSDQSTNLRIPDGMRAVAIQTPTESSSVGQLLVPGNRVDVILTITSRQQDFIDGPATLTLVENAEVLAVGQRFVQPTGSVNPVDDIKSVTLLVYPDMAEEINLASELGKLHLSLRSPGDENATPRRKTSIRDLVAKTAPEQPARDQEINGIRQYIDGLISAVNLRFDQLDAKPESDSSPTFVTIPDGMCAVAILTPNESVSVAGLLRPGNRVDVLLTPDVRKWLPLAENNGSRTQLNTVTFLQNIEVLAVDTQYQGSGGNDDPTVTKSVTLLVTPEMAEEIATAREIGTLTLTLRGPNDGPQTGQQSKSLAQIMNGLQEQSLAAQDEIAATTLRLLVNRGGFSQVVRVPIWNR